MHAGDATRGFKTLVIGWLEATGAGFDTRYRYYRERFPELATDVLARRICDPIERYDPDWPSYRAAWGDGGVSEEQALAHFVAERDERFRSAAAAAIYCFDEAGFGSGTNVMRFIQAGKPVFGFFAADPALRRINLTNVLQLEAAFPAQVRVAAYRHAGDVTARLAQWLGAPPAARPGR